MANELKGKKSIAMNKGYTGRVGIETLTADQSAYWEKKGVTFRPILEYNPLTKEEEQRLKTEYYDNNNRVGFEKLYAAVRQPNGKSKTGKHQFSPTIRQVQAWSAQQTVVQDYKPVEKPKDSRPILVSKVNELIQMDYVVMTEKMMFGKHRHILNAIDVLSKKAYSRSPLTPVGTAPTAAQTLKIAKEIFDEMKKEHGSYPKRLQTDNGSHFLGVFEKGLQPGGALAAIKYTSGMRYRATSQSVVERFNQTLRNMIKRYVASGKKDWPVHLQQFVDNYNKNRHTTVRMAPNMAAQAESNPEAKKLLQQSKDRIKERAKQRNKNKVCCVNVHVRQVANLFVHVLHQIPLAFVVELLIQRRYGLVVEDSVVLLRPEVDRRDCEGALVGERFPLRYAFLLVVLRAPFGPLIPDAVSTSLSLQCHTNLLPLLVRLWHADVEQFDLLLG